MADAKIDTIVTDGRGMAKDVTLDAGMVFCVDCLRARKAPPNRSHA
jgi:hypothetical protein